MCYRMSSGGIRCWSKQRRLSNVFLFCVNSGPRRKGVVPTDTLFVNVREVAAPADINGNFERGGDSKNDTQRQRVNQDTVDVGMPYAKRLRTGGNLLWIQDLSLMFEFMMMLAWMLW